MQKITRRALYDLVWSKPRTELAKQFNVSDVALGKLCRQMNVPAPPPGYWAHVAAKGRSKSKFVRPPLTYTVAERIDEDHAEIRKSLQEVDPKKLDDPLPPPPSFAQAPDEAVGRYVELARSVPLPNPSRGVHPIVGKLVDEDKRLAALATTYSWERPKYQSIQGKQLLAGLNRLLWWWQDLGFEPGSSGTRHIRLYVSLGSHHQSFQIAASADDQGAAAASKSSPPVFELRFDVDSRHLRQNGKPALTFTSFEPDVFLATARLLIQRHETGFRDWLTHVYKHTVWTRNEAIKNDHAVKEAARQRVEAQRKALLAAREKAIDEAISGMTKADQLRSLVIEMEQRMESRECDSSVFAQWKDWMLEKAHDLDIRTKPVDAIVEWMESFCLSIDHRDSPSAEQSG